MLTGRHLLSISRDLSLYEDTSKVKYTVPRDMSDLKDFVERDIRAPYVM